MKKIKFRIERWGNSIVFQVLEMDERFRSNDGKNNYFVHPNGITIASIWGPELDDRYVHLWGNGEEEDNKVVVRVCDTEEEAVEYKRKVVVALKSFAKHWAGWEDDSDKIEDKTIYEF